MGDGSPEHKYDVFISYSRKDVEFVRKLQRALCNYVPPRDLPVPQRRLRVFRDESDFQGTEYGAAVEQNLKSASKLLVISSPNSRASAYVGGEIRTFVELRGKENVISLLLAGVPNNDTAADEGQKAFHDELVSRVSIPLAADYRGYDAVRDRVDRDRFESAWYKVLADIYAGYNVDRNGIEQREKIRQRRTRRIRVAVACVVTAALASLIIWRREAMAQRNIAESRFLAAQSMSGTQPLDMTLLLAAAGYRTAPTAEAWEALLLGLQRQPYVARFLHGHRGAPAGLAVSADGACAAASTEDRTTVWDLGTGQVRAEIRMPGGRPTVHALASGCATLASGFEDGTVQNWSVERSPMQRWSVSGSGKPVTAVAVDSRHNRLAASDGGGRLVMRSLDNGEVVAEVPDALGSGAKVLRFDAGGAVLASVARHYGVDRNYMVRRWSADALVPLGKPVKCLGDGDKLALSRDLNRCAVGSDPPGSATVTDLNSPNAPEAQVGGPWIVALDFSHDGRSLLTAIQGGDIQLWDLEAAKHDRAGSAARRQPGSAAKPTTVLAEHRADVTAVASSPNGGFLSSARDQKVIVWHGSPSGRLVKEMPNPTREFAEAALDSSLRLMATANVKGDLFLANLNEPAAPVAAGSLGKNVSAVAIREESREIFAGTADGDVTGLGIDSGRRRSFSTGHRERIERLRFDAAGSRLAAVAENGTVTLWNLADGHRVATFSGGKARKGRRGGITASVDVAFEPGGVRLASVHGDQQAFLWDWTGSEFRYHLFPFKPTSYFTSVAFGPDGKIALGTGIYEGATALFDSLNTRPAAAILAGHEQMDVTGVAFSPDGRLLLSGGFDARVNVWDVAGRRRIGDAYRVPGPVDSITFATSGLAAAAVTDRGTVVRWDFDPSHWLEIACRVANRNLTAEERQRLLGRPDGEPTCPALGR